MTPALRLLGRATYHDTPITSARIRALLAVLADDGGTVGAHRLAEAVWTDDAPANPSKALQVLVSRTRGRLGPEVVESTPTGYRLGLSGDEVDVVLARSRAGEALHALANRHAPEALVSAEEGLALWDGDTAPPADPADPFVQLVAAMEAVRSDLMRTRAIALSRCGRHEQAVAALEDVLRRTPRDEEVLAALLNSESRAVSHAAALGRYESYRRALRDELGSDPGPALREVHTSLLSEARPVRRGVRHDPNPLLGRERDIERLRELMSSSRVTSIIGQGGLGKTRMAHALGRSAEEGVVHLVELVGVSTPEGVLPEVASVLGTRQSSRIVRTVPGRPARDILSAIVEDLGTAPTLLVLDNCEHVIDAVAHLVDVLVGRVPRLRVLTTSRAPLEISAERTYLLPQLDVTTSLQLFTQRARAVRPDAVLDRAALERLCTQLDGLPLAIELAAARTRTMSLSEIDQRLTDRFALLRGGGRSRPARHQTLLAVMEWSWKLLTETERAALCQLGTFPDGFTSEAAADVLSALPGIPADLAEDALDGLVAQSLLTVEDSPMGARFRMLETVREYTQLERHRRGEQERARTLLRGWARRYALRWQERVFGSDQVEAVDRIRTEETNLDHVLRDAVADRDAPTAVATFAALAALWSIEGNHARVVTMGRSVDAVLYRAPVSEDDLEALRLGLALLAANSVLLTPRRAVRSLTRLRRLPDAPAGSVAEALHRAIALILRAGGLQEPAALAVLYESEDPSTAAVGHALASQLWENLGDLAPAAEHARRGLAVAARTPDPWGTAQAHARVAELAMQMEDIDTADEHAALALPVIERLQAWSEVVQQRGIRLVAALRRGDLAAAERFLPGTELAVPPDRTFRISVIEHTMRAETELARGEVKTGLARYRRAVDQVQDAALAPWFVDAEGLEPWTIHTEATALVAHVRHGHLSDVSGLPERLTRKVIRLVEGEAPFLDYPVCGTAMLALGLVDLLGTPQERPGEGNTATGRRGARLVALAVAFGYSRTYPSLSLAPAQKAARRGDSAAYDEARGRYAGLDRDELRGEASRVLRGEQSGYTP